MVMMLMMILQIFRSPNFNGVEIHSPAVQVSVGFEVGVEVLNRVEVLEFEVKLLDVVFCLPFENLGKVVHGGILDVVGWADDADNG